MEFMGAEITRTEHRYFVYIKSGRRMCYTTSRFFGNAGNLDFWAIESTGYKERRNAIKRAKAEMEREERRGQEIGIADVKLEYTKNEKGCERPYRYVCKHIEIYTEE